MSKWEEVTIKCPNCGKVSKFKLWDSINTTLDPEMKQKVRDGSAFSFTCPHCGYQTYIYRRFLYHQMEDKVLIQYCETDKEETEFIQFFNQNNPDFPTNFKAEGYWIRIVRSMNDLREKLFILDEGLDDRVIEICKLFVLSEVYKKYPDLNVKEDMFVPGNNGEKYIQIIYAEEIGKISTLMAIIPDDLYEMVKSNIVDTINDDSFTVDQNWAEAILQNQ